jgi:hypothetical protein
VAGRADLGVDLQATLELHLVEGAEGTFMGEGKVLDVPVAPAASAAPVESPNATPP